MSKHVCLRVLSVIALVTLLAPAIDAARSDVDFCLSGVTVNSPGVVIVCPAGDGTPLNNAVGNINCTITITALDGDGVGISGIPITDMWLVGCGSGLLLCGGNDGSRPDSATDSAGQATFSNEPLASGCDAGLYAVLQGVVMGVAGSCVPTCLPIAARSPDYKSAGAPGPAPCPGDVMCPDGKVTNADYSWFGTHYATSSNPNAPYSACADFSLPFGVITLADFTQSVAHFIGNHKCTL